MLIQYPRVFRRFLLCLGAFLLIGSNSRADVITGKETITVAFGDTSNVTANISYLVFDESTLSASPIEYAWYYDGLINPTSGTNWSGTDLLNAVLADSQGTPYALSFTTGAFGLTKSFTIGSTTSVVDPTANPGPVWTYWMKGGSEYVPYGDNTDFTFNQPSSDWAISPNTSDARWLTNGSYDAWTISPYSYSDGVNSSDTYYYTDTNGISQPVTIGTYGGAAPLSIPEPTSLALLALAAGGMFLYLRWSRGKRL